MEMEGFSLDFLYRIRKWPLLALCIVIAACVIISISIGFTWNHIFETQKNLITPYCFPGSVWRSTEPEIVLAVSKNSPIPSDSFCYIVFEGRQIEVIFYPGYPQRASIELRDAEALDIQDVRLIICDASFSENRVGLKVIQDNLFNGEYKNITLERVS